MKSEKETIYDYAAELKLLAFKEELECILSLAAEENWNHLQFFARNCLERKAPGEGSVEEDQG